MTLLGFLDLLGLCTHKHVIKCKHASTCKYMAMLGSKNTVKPPLWDYHTACLNIMQQILISFNVCTFTITKASGIPRRRRIPQVDLTQTTPPNNGGKSNLSDWYTWSYKINQKIKQFYLSKHFKKNYILNPDISLFSISNNWF